MHEGHYTNLFEHCPEFLNSTYVFTDKAHATITLELREAEFTFANLVLLSEMFGTRDINMSSEQRDDGYCETCSSPYSVQIVRISNVTAWPVQSE